MANCVTLKSCLAVTYRLNDGLCNLLDRTYNKKFEESDERVVANKIGNCETEAPHAVQELSKAQVGIRVSEQAQKCFSNVVFGRSPGSNMGNSTETSVDDCMSSCAALKGCLAMTFRLSDGFCALLDRSYEGKYEVSDERLVANKLGRCGGASSGFGHKVLEIIASPFKMVASLISKLAHLI